jgi:hypothetical protein
LLQIAPKNRKYHLSKELIDFALASYESIFDITHGYLSEIITLNKLMISSSQMSLRAEEMLRVVLWYCLGTGELMNFTKSIEHALHKVKNPELETAFTKLHEQRIDTSLKIKDVHSLDNYIQKLEEENNSFFNGSEYKQKLYELYLERGLLSRDMIALTHLQKAVEGFNRIRDKQNEQRALRALQEFLNDNDIEWHKSVTKLDEEHIKQFEDLRALLKEFLHHSRIKDIILMINKVINISLIENGVKSNPIQVYMPCPNYTSIKAGVRKTPLTDIFKGSTIGDGRIMKDTEEPKYRNVYYDLNMGSSVIPVIERFEENLEELAKCIDEIIEDSNWISTSTVKYLRKVITFFEEDKAFEFMHSSVVLTERLLRDLYQALKGSKIKTMKTTPAAQINVNLQDIMKDDDIKNFFGESIYKYIEYNLIDERGLNFRNLILHGLIGIEVFHHQYSRLLLHIILVIIAHGNDNLTKEEEGEESGS